MGEMIYYYLIKLISRGLPKMGFMYNNESPRKKGKNHTN